MLVSIWEKFCPNSIWNKFAKELKTNAACKKSALVLAFAYDVIIMLFYALFELKNFRFEWLFVPTYEIITLGGIFMFYIPFFSILKIQDKLRKS